MQLIQKRKYETSTDFSYIWGFIAMSDSSIVACANNRNCEFFLIRFLHGNVEIFQPELTGYNFSKIGYPVLLPTATGFGLLVDAKEVYWYPEWGSAPEIITINNEISPGKRFPHTVRMDYYISPLGENNKFPIKIQCQKVFDGYSRHIAMLNVDTVNKTAVWENCLSLAKNLFLPACSRNLPQLPKIDESMLCDGVIIVFTSGEKITSVNKWGMDYYGIAKCALGSQNWEVIYNSGNLQLLDGKKHGANGLFTFSKEYVIVTPVFKSDEWRGKQKLYCLATNEILDVQLPRGLSKYKIFSHIGNEFWLTGPNGIVSTCVIANA